MILGLMHGYSIGVLLAYAAIATPLAIASFVSLHRADHVFAALFDWWQRRRNAFDERVASLKADGWAPRDEPQPWPQRPGHPTHNVTPAERSSALEFRRIARR